MTLQAELLVDRRKLKRRLSGWRLSAIFLGLALLFTALYQLDSIKLALDVKPHIARVTVSGLIRDDRKQRELLASIARSARVKAVIVAIDSRGGTTTGGESLYEAIRELASKKPVVSVMGTIATSAGYMVALASDHVVARSNTITGSVGVIVQWPQLTEMLDSLGIKVEEVRSGELKANPSPFRPLDERGRAVTQEMVREAQAWFLGLVAKRRLIDPSTVPGLQEGSVFSGRKALEHKLVDAVGGEKVAIAWLEKERQVAKDLKVIDWESSSSSSFGLTSLVADFLAYVTGIAPESIQGIMTFGTSIGGSQLDGLVSLWHPQVR